MGYGMAECGDSVNMYQTHIGLLCTFYTLLTPGVNELNEQARKFDARGKYVLAIICITAAHGLHGYIGFVYGSLKAREWWSSDMMPVIFIFSAIVSGVSVIIILYLVACWVRKMKIDEEAVHGMAWQLWGFLMFSLLLELVEFGTMVYKGLEGIDNIMDFVSSELLIPYFTLQLGIGAALPIVILSLMSFMHVRGKPFLIGTVVSAGLVLMSVFMMRWNVVIGGQEISKTGKGLLHFDPIWVGSEGIWMAVAILAASIGFLLILLKILPPWADMDGSHAVAASDSGEEPTAVTQQA